MKKMLLVIGISALLLAMPTLLAFPTPQQHSKLLSSPGVSDGTFAGGLGRGHFQSGSFIIDSVYAYINGVYWRGVYKKILGDITNLNYEKIGEIGAYIGHKLIIGYIKSMQGNRAPIIGFVIISKDNQFVGRVMSVAGPAPNIWGSFIPNT